MKKLTIPCGHDGTDGDCSLCRVFRTDDVYNRKWGGPGVAPEDRVARTPAAAESPGPSWWRRGWSFLIASGRFLAAGLPLCDRETWERRTAACEACPHFDPDGGACKLCGCAIHLKAAMKTERCPDDPPRW